MQSNRNVVIIGIPLWLLVFSSGILCRWIIVPPENLNGSWVSVSIGGIMGLLVCWWLYRVWDPKTLSSKGKFDENTPGCWMHFAVIGGIVLANITPTILPFNFSQSLAVSLIVTIYMVFIYSTGQVFSIQAWINKIGDQSLVGRNGRFPHSPFVARTAVFYFTQRRRDAKGKRKIRVYLSLFVSSIFGC